MSAGAGQMEALRDELAATNQRVDDLMNCLASAFNAAGEPLPEPLRGCRQAPRGHLRLVHDGAR
jgi:hypothetical protein